eukprot:jgi/Chlat1/7122/Chrsp57S06735
MSAAARYPSTRLRAELSGTESALVGEEGLYALLRPFGRLTQVELGTMPKEGPRVATVVFQKPEASVAALNCAHRAFVPGTESCKVRLSYLPYLRSSIVQDYISKHPRIVVPVFGILLALGTYLVFDPLRIMSIDNRITGRLARKAKLSTGQIIEWLSFDRLRLGHGVGTEDTAVATWQAREQDAQQVAKWLDRAPARPLFLSGPYGSGALDLLSRVLKDRDTQNVVNIDVRSMLDRADDEFVTALAASVGFMPGFTFLSYVTSFLDVFTPGAAAAKQQGVAAGNVIKILDCVDAALERIRTRQINAAAATSQAPAGRDDEAVAAKVPLFVITGFTEDNADKKSHFLYTLVTRLGLARVIFVTDRTSLEKDVASAHPWIALDSVRLADASRDAAVQFVAQHLDEDADNLDEDSLQAIAVLGGRFSDLQTLVRSIKAGTPVHEAVAEIVRDAIEDVRSYLFGTDAQHKKGAAKWSQAQLWNVILAMAASKSGEVEYDAMLFNVFKGNDDALDSLVRAQLLQVNLQPNKPATLRTGSPVMLEAMRKIAADERLRPGLDLLAASAQLEPLSATISGLENELVKLKDITTTATSNTWSPVGDARDTQEFAESRRRFLIARLAETHEKFCKADEVRRRCEQRLKEAHS